MVFPMNDRDTLAAVLPPERQRIGKRHMLAIERDR
jgi:hypothetical protein